MVVSVFVAIGVYTALAGDTAPPRENDIAPSFALSTPDGATLTLASQLQDRDAVVLVFYRGYF
jgi:peroxiredoxin